MLIMDKGKQPEIKQILSKFKDRLIDLYDKISYVVDIISEESDLEDIVMSEGE
jgi:hypothetical protein